MSAWWVGLPPVRSTLTCGGARHRLEWRAGALYALDHDDPEGERTLIALGAESCACLEVLDAWEKLVSDERVLVAGSRGPGDRIPIEDWGVRDDDDEPFYEGVQPRDEYGLLRLPGGIGDRLVATVAAAVAGGKPTARVHTALYGRVLPVLETWLGRSLLELSLELGDTPSLSLEGDGVRVELPFTWLVDVWARGLAVVLGRFTLAARVDGDTYVLSTLTLDLAPEEVRIAMNPARPGSQTGT